MKLFNSLIIQISNFTSYALGRKIEQLIFYSDQKKWELIKANSLHTQLISLFLITLCFINIVSAQSIDTVFHTGNSPLSYNIVNAVVTDDNNNVWIGTEFGLNRFNETGWQSWFSDSSDLPGDAIRALAVDKNNALWIGNFQAPLSILIDNKFQLFDKPEELTDFIRDILFVEDSVKTMFLATASGLGIYSFQNEQWDIYNFETSPYLVSQHFTSIVYLPNDGIYAGSINGGLINLKENGNIRVLFGEETGLPDNTILDVAVDTTGLLWLATPEGGLVSYNGQTFESINPSNSDMPSRSISSIVVTSENEIWCGTIDAGVVHLSKKGINVFNTDNSSLLSNKINDLYLQNDSIVWAATDMGLARICTFDKMLSASPNFPVLETNLAYPNPCNGNLKMNSTYFLDEIIVYNNLGNIVYRSLQPSSNINLNHLSKGSYILNLKTTNTLYVQKILIL